MRRSKGGVGDKGMGIVVHLYAILWGTVPAETKTMVGRAASDDMVTGDPYFRHGVCTDGLVLWSGGEFLGFKSRGSEDGTDDNG